MSNLTLFMKKNKKQRENAFFPATASLLDEKGKPVLWEIRPLTISEDEAIREECTKEVPVPGKRNQFRMKIDVNLYMAKQMVAAIVTPNLFDAALQDSYGVKTPEDLLKEMVDRPGEYVDFGNFIREISGFESELSEEIEEAKN